jgi:hypothetical protein
MAFVGDDAVERVDGDVDLFGFVVDLFFAKCKSRRAAEQADGNSLNCRDINEGVTRLRNAVKDF